MRTVLVTGGAGFLGSHLCEQLLARGEQVICLDNLLTGVKENIAPLLGHPRFTFVLGNVINGFAADVQQIYHLACPAAPDHYRRNPVDTLQTTFEGTRQMLALAHAVGARFLLASTSEVYGHASEHPQRESFWGHVNPIGPRACYTEGKRCAEALTTCWAQQYGTPVRIARLFNAFGPRLHHQDGRVVANFVTQALRGTPLTVYGDGTQTRSLCYVDDTIDGLIRLMELALAAEPESPSAADLPVNIGNPHELTIRSLADLVLQLTGSRSSIIYRPLPGDDPPRRCPDINRARTQLGWEPRCSLEAGLARTIEWFAEHTQRPTKREEIYGRASTEDARQV